MSGLTTQDLLEDNSRDLAANLGLQTIRQPQPVAIPEPWKDSSSVFLVHDMSTDSSLCSFCAKLVPPQGGYLPLNTPIISLVFENLQEKNGQKMCLL